MEDRAHTFYTRVDRGGSSPHILQQRKVVVASEGGDVTTKGR